MIGIAKTNVYEPCMSFVADCMYVAVVVVLVVAAAAVVVVVSSSSSGSGTKLS